MPDNEDWRFEKARELGLVDMGPLAGRRDARPHSKPVARPVPPTPPAPAGNTAPPPVTAAAPPAAPDIVPPVREAPPALPIEPRAVAQPSPPPPSARPAAAAVPAPPRVSPALRAAALAVALFAAAAGGWLLHAVLGTPDPVMTIAARQAAGTATPATRPMVAANPAPVPEPSATAVPAAVAEATVAPAPAVQRAAMATAPKPSVQRDAALEAEAARTAAALPAVAPPAVARSAASRTVAEPPAPVADRRPPVVTSVDASFDCRRAQTEVNRMICADARLGALDAAMGEAYRAAVERGGVAAEYDIDREQASFLNARASCETPGCIARITRQRLDDLYNY
ncbi:hypothetical protein [Sandarakinorhabdus sp. DWP1-3-1]|uniref:lysozyme inhibitor LprI family protein n=1 Tax=Sandarakinorhabdus sp. DWP1-3-1 TaxID=2804627 RepID=UPI003CFBAFC6